MEALPIWEADKRLLPKHLRGRGDNSRDVRNLRLGLRAAMETRLSQGQRELLTLCYCEGKTKTEIGALLGVGSSTVCKALRVAEKAVREYALLYTSVCERVRRDIMREDDENEDIRGEVYDRNLKQHNRNHGGIQG